MAEHKGFRVTHELVEQVSALARIGDETSGLVASAGRLAERQPLLGGAPPAVLLAKRLRAAAAALTAEIGAADAELASYHSALRETIARYQNGDREIAWKLSSSGGQAT